MSKKKKFELTKLVNQGVLKEGDTLYFVSDPSKSCQIARQPNGEYKVVVEDETTTVHAFATKCLGTEPPDHASRWLKTSSGHTLYELWHAEDDYSYAA